MTLVDTSVWIDHFRAGDPGLTRELQQGRVAVHPFVIGELAVGHLRRRAEILELLAELPTIDVSPHTVVLQFVDQHALDATGIGWIDAHLLCGATRAGVPIWTRDLKLRKQAATLGLT